MQQLPWHSVARLGGNKSAHPSLEGVQSGVTFMERDLEIMSGIRDAFVLWPSNPISGTLSYKNICTRMKWLTYKVLQFGVVCPCSATYYLCAVSVKWSLLNVYFPFSFWSQKEGRGPWGSSSYYDWRLSPFRRLFLYGRVCRWQNGNCDGAIYRPPGAN